MSRAEYMRNYRAQKKNFAVEYVDPAPARQAKRIAELEAEVKFLKEELAKRPRRVPLESPESMRRHADVLAGGFNSRPFTPAPKKGK